MKGIPLILIVEDNPDNRLLIHDILDLMHYDVIEASNGIDAVRLAMTRKPSLILMDLSLPQKDGWAATRELRADPGTAHIPIIALTAHAMFSQREEALKAGCTDYLTKPINFAELSRKLKAYLPES